jgi:hypothetical protein
MNFPGRKRVFVGNLDACERALDAFSVLPPSATSRSASPQPQSPTPGAPMSACTEGALASLAHVYVEMGEPERAKETAERAIALLQERGSKIQELENVVALERAEVALGHDGTVDPLLARAEAHRLHRGWARRDMRSESAFSCQQSAVSRETHGAARPAAHSGAGPPADSTRNASYTYPSCAPRSSL